MPSTTAPVHSAALAGSLRQIGHDLRGAWRIAADRRSFGCYAVDIFFHRLLRLFKVRSYNRLRRIFIEGGIEITYRRNRGDIYTVREIWIDEIYRLPDGHTPKTVVDLGAHIGLASLWFAKIYGPSFIVAVEAAASNAALASRNLQRNSVPAKVIEAAVGREDGRGFFREARASNLGRLGEAGDEVDVLSIQTLLGHMPEGTDVDLLKIDLEGEEQAIFAGELSWLRRVRAIVAEFHPNVDADALTRSLAEAGFQELDTYGSPGRPTRYYVRDDVA